MGESKGEIRESESKPKPAPTPMYDRDGVQLYHGDSAEVLPALGVKANLIVTSPPYGDLREFGGHRFDFDKVAPAVAQGLTRGGVLCWVTMDEVVDGGETGTSMRQALAFMGDYGLRLHDTMIYARKSNSSVSNTNRHWRMWQYMFILSLGKPATVNIIQDYPRSPNSGANVGWKPMRMPDGSMRPIPPLKLPKLLRRGNVWVYDAGYNKCHPPAENVAHEHPATYPYQLAYDHIRTWTRPDDLVIDPMMGSGTTLSAALALGRRAIGIEIHEPYIDIAIRRLAIAARHKREGVDPWGMQISKLF